MSRHQPQLSDEEAKRLLQRAVELQQEAEQKAPGALAPASDASGLSLEHITQAAEGAGIQSDFVITALAEQQLPDASEIRRDSRRARWLRGTVSAVDALEVVRLVHGPLERVAAALRVVAVQPAFNMLLENTVAYGDDVADRVLVYRLQGGFSNFSGTLNFADVRVLLITLRRTAEGTLVRVRAPLFRRGVNLGVAGISTALGGVAGSWSGWAVAGVVAGALGVGAGSALVIPAGLGALAGGALGLGGFRFLYDNLARQGELALGSFLSSVALEVEAHAVALPRSDAD